MTDQHLTPPPELVQQWYDECPIENRPSLPYITTQAARWGADAELEECVRWLRDEMLAPTEWSTGLRKARRPVQPSLKEQALKVLENVATYEPMGYAKPDNRLSEKDCYIIRAALEQLPDAPAVPPAADARGPGSVANIIDATDEELTATASQALDNYKYASEMPYFLAPDATENEPLMLMLRAIYNLGREHGGATVKIQLTATTPAKESVQISAIELSNIIHEVDPGHDALNSPTNSSEDLAHALLNCPGLSILKDPAPTADGGKPLWDAMHSAYLAVVENSMIPAHGAGLAAELRVVADWLERRQLDDYAVVLPDVGEVIGWLRAEAELADNVA